MSRRKGKGLPPLRPRLSGEPRALLQRAVRLHGHLGPFLALGVRLGLAVREALEAKGYFDLEVEVACPLRTPYSCLVDGVMVATGCTPGKRNLRLKASSSRPEVRGRSKGSLRATARPREEVWERLRSGFPEEEMPALAEWLISAPQEEIVEVELPTEGARKKT